MRRIWRDYLRKLNCCIIIFSGLACTTKPTAATTEDAPYFINKQPTPVTTPLFADSISTGQTTRVQLLAFAQTLKGIGYKYGSANPQNGFDCSGFITYVFNHFGIQVPRSSVDFTNVKNEVKLNQAQPGDLILFTGTDSTRRVVGHMGIITVVNNGAITFIHATSGTAYGVTETPLNTYYQGRYMKTIRVFAANKL